MSVFQDLLKCGTGPNSSGNLQSALDSMLAVLRTVNDSMHQVAISGYQVKGLFQNNKFIQNFVMNMHQ